MQTSPLPNLAGGVNVNGAPQRAAGSSDGDDGQFSAALSREIEQRGDAAPTQPQQPTHASTSKPGAKPQPVQAPAQAPAQQSSQDAGAADTLSALAGKDVAQADAASVQDDAATDDSTAASQHAADPMADMLALVANYNQMLKQGTAAPKAAAAGGTAAAAQATPGATLAPAGLPSDQAIAAIAGRFASQMQQMHQGGEATTAPAGAPGRAALAQVSGKAAGAAQAGQAPLASSTPTSAPSAAPASAPGAQASLSASTAPSLAPSLAPGMGPTFAPTGAPGAAPAEFSAHLANALPDAAAAQLLAATTAPVIAPMAAQLAGVGDKISARVGTSAWDEQVGQKIVWMVGGGEQSASLTLNPPDLGPMQVVLSVNGDQASVAFSSAHQEVRHALESALPRLREMMDQSGLSLGSATVSAGSQGQAQDPGQRQGGGGSGPRFGSQGTDTVAATDTVEAPRVRRTTLVGDNGMVDTFA
jgi:flagellar hook-length control protein FliK